MGMGQVANRIIDRCGRVESSGGSHGAVGNVGGLGDDGATSMIVRP